MVYDKIKIEDIYAQAGKRIRLVRERKQYTRDYVAMKADISSKFLYEIEHGNKGFSADRLYKLSRTLEISCEYILCGGTVDNSTDISEIMNNFSPEQVECLISIIRIIDKMIL